MSDEEKELLSKNQKYVLWISAIIIMIATYLTLQWSEVFSEYTNSTGNIVSFIIALGFGWIPFLIVTIIKGRWI